MNEMNKVNVWKRVKVLKETKIYVRKTAENEWIQVLVEQH